VIATSLVLVAVFVPVALFSGHYRNFVPAICADDCVFRGYFRVQRIDPDSGAFRDFLGRHRERAQGKFFKLFNDAFNAGSELYRIPCGER